MELSFTKLRVYRECPWKYRLQMVEGRRIPLSPAGSLGISLHRALERYHRELGADLERCYEECFMPAGYPDNDTRVIWKAKGARILSTYLEAERGRRTHIAAVEREFVFEVGAHQARGTIDRIDRHPDDRIEVIDYKTQPGGHADETDRLQLRFYGLGCREAVGWVPSLLTDYFIADARKESFAYVPSEDLVLKDLIVRTADKIVEGDFTPDTSFCPKCDFRKTCAYSVARD